jgi:hypothetical protein
MVSFKWTTVVMTDVDPLSPDDYTGSSVQTTFYPNSKKYKFTNEKQSKTVDLDDDPGMETTLTNQGWIKDAFPVAKSGPTPYEKEASLRSDLKWDSVDHRIKNIRADDVKSPMFHIHAISRGSRTVNAKVKFALILTVEAPKATIDLYSRVKILYPNLLPVNAIVQATVKVG